MPNEKYNRLIEGINFEGIEVDSLECRQNRELRESGKKRTSINLKHDVVSADVEGQTLIIKVEFNLEAVLHEDTESEDVDSEDDDSEDDDAIDENILFSMVFQMNMKYILELDDVSGSIVEEYEEELKQFIDNNASINAWPYARETISSLSTRMGFPVLTIPMYKLMPKY